EFAALERYHDVFRSCNRAFYTDPAQRLDHWCGTCDKCCFIDLVLSPFLGEDELRRIFGSHEPLATPALEPIFRSLLGAGPRPFECVGDEGECRTAAVLAARRPDRAAYPMLQHLAQLAGEEGEEGELQSSCLFRRHGPDFVPAGFS
nr:hypothetical protein [Actinomycetota bacterium]